MGRPGRGRQGRRRRPPPVPGGRQLSGPDPVRFWTVEEARAYLPRLRELVERVRVASDAVARAKANGHGPSGDQVEEAMRELAEGDIIVRDPSTGLVDFHARGADGVVYYLCWLAGEDDLAWWHLPAEGFAGRKPLPRDPA